MSQTRLTEFFTSRKRAADSIDGNVSKKLKIINEAPISQIDDVRITRSKTASRTVKTVRVRAPPKSASKAVKTPAKDVQDSESKIEKTKNEDNVPVFDAASKADFSIFCEKAKAPSTVTKNLFPEEEKANGGQKIKKIVVDEASKKSIQEKLKSSNLFELRQKLSELHGKSPLKCPPCLSSPTKSSVVGRSPMKMNLLRSPTKLLTPLKKDQLATPTKSPLKYDAKNLLTSPTKMLQSILSSPTKAAPQVQREPSSSTAPLSLPTAYSHLQNVFSSVDLVVSMLTNRHEICTFDKLTKAVKQMTRRDFTSKHLEQIKTVYPGAYIFRQEIGLPSFGQGRTTQYQLTIEANFDEDSGPSQPTSPQKSMKFTPAKITERKALFHSKLLDVVKRHHDEFLTKLMLNVDNSKLTKWHPQFKIEEIPEILSSELPSPPESSKPLQAQEFLRLASGMDSRVKKALEVTASSKVTDEVKEVQIKEEKSGNNTSSNTTTNVVAPVKGISSSLLDRIRAKEAQKVQKMMVESPEDVQKKRQLQKLPEFCRTIYHSFTTHKRPAMPQDDAVRALTSSGDGFLSSKEAENYLKMMSEVLPEWMSFARVSSGVYIKLNKTVEIGAVLKKLDALLKID